MFSEKMVFVTPPPPPPEGRIVMVRPFVPTPTELDAEMIAKFVLAANGVPVMRPFVVLILAHDGKFEAPNEVGALDAVIW